MDGVIHIQGKITHSLSYSQSSLEMSWQTQPEMCFTNLLHTSQYSQVNNWA
jgi:hypothetical protein